MATLFFRRIRTRLSVDYFPLTFVFFKLNLLLVRSDQPQTIIVKRLIEERSRVRVEALQSGPSPSLQPGEPKPGEDWGIYPPNNLTVSPQ